MTRRKKLKRPYGVTEKRMVAGIALLAAAAGLTIAAGQIPDAAEWYRQHIYQCIVFIGGRVSGILPFSLAELSLYVLVLFLIGTFIHAVVQMLRGKSGGAQMLKWSSGLFLAASIFVFLYVVNCGINYKSVSFSEKAGFQTEAYTSDDLKEVCLLLTEKINETSLGVERDENGVMKLSAPEQEGAVQAMEKLGKQYAVLQGYYPQPKGLLVSQLLSYQNLAGIYLPFTVEANYNQHMTPYNIPFTVCHELSHLRGFMQEEEANFIAFLACKDAERDDFKYSGYLMAWVYCMNTLYKNDSTVWQEVRAELCQGAETDLQANSQFWASYEGVVAEVSNKMNDTYLKANGQTDGVKSYDRMVDLIVAYYQK